MSADLKKVVVVLSGDTLSERVAGPWLQDHAEEQLHADYAGLPGLDEAVCEVLDRGWSDILGVAATPVATTDLDDESWALLVWRTIRATGQARGTWVEPGPGEGVSVEVVTAAQPSWLGSDPLVGGEPVGGEVSWGELRAAAQRAVTAAHEPSLVGLTRRLREAEARVSAARAAQREAMRAAMSAGMSAYRVAQVVGVTQRAVHKIRDQV